ncbi:hypothetical protein EHQ92_00835 [Leptospira biflexa]|jgi:hypothetical protein|uniref:DinB-like domain-containing protein n=1 Tax=Leptospira biflexa serovar Patoc (strain Patoc 1 / ATCC 23582 / Paris) TaxID=456481 RepID=B0SNU9_LEPBP|nr:Conserved hypothetical protein [Leptospira biflexa serovar Patoc strain 'Patoc 1 (Paris)']TGM31815.1 hypothetical protein EHQ89_15775 [Leptospira biflexa]TGM36958.1 hypothetical protein EHQ80_04980 [Leptospira biflexa]TGM46501.1 hypothetical protein EHQ92_00835 [Leptospira biflexa]TGM51037.1 hypothetical protein EHQ88_12250 [Leptospira biflexa]
MNETDMVTEILEIFWKEKLRFAQYCFDELSHLDGKSFVGKTDSGKSPEWVLHQMVSYDKTFRFYLPISLKISSFFFFNSFKDQEIEKDLESIRDRYTPPAFPSHFWEIQISEAHQLKIKATDPLVKAQCDVWKEVLLQLESKLSLISQTDAYRKRYTSLTGIHTISGAINNSTEFCHHLWNTYMANPN